MKTILLAILTLGLVLAPASQLKAVCQDPPLDPPIKPPGEGARTPTPTPSPTPVKPNK